ncbi:peptidoglycan-binding domain-containing protein [Microvirga thermotolerans]|uniref:Serine protease n=1 Tax=Microvirga thermotolerans TaxID=2651334 RepID=A0A5P9JVB1_9HYPH|nr:peptidoglycan-binding protein [Microvirga thermotolerans]QFU15586.1 serine protease [Microvirga thermotolerans]
MNRACLRPVLHLCAALAAIVGVSGGATSVLAQPAPGPAARTPDPAVEAARAAFESLPEADRRTIQEGLIWSGDYSGSADGTFGRQTFDAIAAFQKRAGRPATGVLSPADRAALQAGMKNARSAVGFEIITDARTGVQIGVPAKLLTGQGDNPGGGSRWQSADGRITLDTRVAPADATLATLYERNLAIKTPGRVVTYKVLRPDFFVIAGETPTGKFYSRYAAGPSGIRAFSIGYDKSVAPQVDRLVVAIANAFVPFPTAAPAAAPPPAAAAPAPATVAQGVAAAGAQAPFGTGLLVGPRQVLTGAPMDRCRAARVRDVRVQQVKGGGPYLLELAQDLDYKGAPLAVSQQEMASASVLVLAFGADGDGARLGAMAGTVEDGRTVSAPLQPGASGAPVFDRSGALAGFVGALPSNPRKVAGIVPSAPYPLLPAAEAARAFPGLSASEAKPAALGAADLVAMVRPRAVPIACAP